MTGKELNEQTVFEVARTIPSGEVREVYLQQVCRDDAALRQLVTALLRAHDENASFLEFPPDALTESLTIGERPGAWIGPYKLLQQIGEGGVGVVYMAEQTHPVQRAERGPA